MSRSSILLFICMLAAQTAAPAAETPLERGTYLMRSVVACGNCHGVRDDKGQIAMDKSLAGGNLFDEPAFKAYASNITPDPETGIGKWTDAQLAKAIREGVRPDKTIIGPPMPITFYRHMSDADVAAIIVYLRAQPAVRNAVPKSVYKMALPPSYGPALRAVSAPPASDQRRYGEYLANIAHCMECHTPRDDEGMLQAARLGAGGTAFNGPWGQSVSRNITPHESGLKGWSDGEIAKAVRQGLDRNGYSYRPPMAFAFYSHISDADMSALVVYLRSLKPQVTAGKN